MRYVKAEPVWQKLGLPDLRPRHKNDRIDVSRGRHVASAADKAWNVISNAHTVADSGQSVIFIENTEEYPRLEAAFEAFEIWENAA